MLMDRQRAKEYIEKQEPTFLTRASQKGYICPKCKQGATKGNGITRKTGDPTLWFCAGECRKGRSVFGLYAEYIGIPDEPENFPEILERTAEYYGIQIDSSAQEDFRPENQKQPKIERNADPERDFTPFYREAAAHLRETDYPQIRGLSLETCERFNLGFSPRWTHPKAPKAPSSPRLIIPISPYSYLARDTRQDLTEEQEDFKKQLCKGSATPSWTFNREALQTADRPVFVVEGALDALSIIEAGGEAVAVNSTAYIHRFTEELKQAAPAQPLVIALDNDKAGKEAGEALESRLRQIQIPFYRYNPAGEYKDANERLVKDRKGLEEAVAKAGSVDKLEQLKEEERRDNYRMNSAAAHLQEFINGIAASVNTPFIETGFRQLDRTLDGGLYEGLYIVGGISSVGKTSFIVQTADQIAGTGKDVLFFSLEMARTELMAKSISRHTVQEVLSSGGNISNAKTSRGITTGARYAKYNRTERDLIQKAIWKYSSYANHLFISEGIGNIGVDQVRETVEEHIRQTGETPVVIIDYLQILAPSDPRSTDKQNMDKAVLELKRISRDYKTPVIALSSFNRMNYKEAVTMEAFKESGAIEYSADVLIGLQLAGAGGKGFDATQEKKKNPRNIEAVILKNRNGATGDKIQLQYFPRFNYFTEPSAAKGNVNAA